MPKSPRYPLLTAQTADGNSEVISWTGGRGVFRAIGTFGSGTCKLQFSNDDQTTWTDVGAEVTLSADGGGGFELFEGVSIRANLSGSTGASLTAEIL